jgi:hypothetical protein
MVADERGRQPQAFTAGVNGVTGDADDFVKLGTVFAHLLARHRIELRRELMRIRGTFAPA